MKRIYGAVAGALLTTHAYAAEFRTVPEHMAYLGATRDMMRLAPEFSADIRIYDRGSHLDVLRRVFNKTPSQQVMVDSAMTPDMTEDKTCRVFSVTQPNTAVAHLEKLLEFEIENKERFSGYEIAFWVLFHELEHCNQKGAGQLHISPDRVLMETQSDISAIEKIRRVNPNSNIADVVIAFRATKNIYANSVLVKDALSGKKMRDIAQTLKSQRAFVRLLFDKAPRIIPQIPMYVPPADLMMVRGVVLLTFMKDAQFMPDKAMRNWAEDSLKGIRYFAPKRTATYEKIGQGMLKDMAAQVASRLKP